MTRLALYARYSSDQQSAASIEDQLRICRERAASEGWHVVETYSDAAISGASMILRPGIQSLVQDARAGLFDVALAKPWIGSRVTRRTLPRCISIFSFRRCHW